MRQAQHSRTAFRVVRSRNLFMRTMAFRIQSAFSEGLALRRTLSPPSIILSKIRLLIPGLAGRLHAPPETRVSFVEFQARCAGLAIGRERGNQCITTERPGGLRHADCIRERPCGSHKHGSSPCVMQIRHGQLRNAPDPDIPADVCVTIQF